MKIQKLSLPEVLLIEFEEFVDHRGYFYESYNKRDLKKLIGFDINFVQINTAYSNKDVIRGLHFQINPHSQYKLIRVTKGEVFDVVVDARKDSPSFGKWCGYNLSDKNKSQLLVPQGFAHGFLTLSENSELSYLSSDHYYPEFERCVSWRDPFINIDWPIQREPIISDKDNNDNSLKNIFK